MANVDVNSNNTIVTITQTGKEVVNIVTTGPQGPAGTQGIPGPSGSDGTNIDALNAFTGSAQAEIDSLTAVTGSYLTSLPSNLLSSSAQIASNISGSFTAASASFSIRTTTLESNPVFSAAGISGSFNVASSSFSTRIATNETITSKTLLSSSAQISSDISGAFASPFTSAGISGSFTAASSSFSTRVSSLEDGGGGSGFTATGISGSFGITSASLATRIIDNTANISTNTGLTFTNLDKIISLTSVTGSYATTGSISGSFTQPSASFSTRVSTLESGGGSSFTSAGISGSWQGQNFISASQVTPNLPSGTLSSSAQIASDISGAFASPFTAAGISGSFNAASSSFSTRTTTLEANPVFTAAGISGSFTPTSSSFSTRVTTNEANITSITSSLDVNRVVFTTTGGQLATDAGMTYDSTNDKLTVQSLNVVHLTSSFITASTIQTSGSNIFGDATNDVQTLIGTTKITGSAEINGNTQITGSLDVSGSITTFDINMSTWTLGADGGSNYYYFTGPGDLNGTEQNPDIHLTRGQKYRFYNPMDAHPFQIQDTGGSAFSTGVTNNGVSLGFLSFDVPMDGPTHLKYQCTAHAAMIGNIYISDARVASGSFSGSFQGDGSALTNLPSTSPFPFTGDAQITGSLIVSGSFNSFIWDTSAIVLGEGAGASLIKSANVSEDTVIIGSNAANNLTYTDFNTVVGANAGRGLVAHQSSTFLGSNAGRAAAASKNTAVGTDAGYYASGKNNAYLGYSAGYGNSSNGDQAGNVAIGAESLYSIYTGDYNIGIGYKAGYNISTGIGNIIIGSGSLGTTTMNDQLRIGHADLHVISASLETGDIILQGNVSSSATSTASFGTYLGDGSQLSGISSNPFPFTGDAQITGSLTISGSLHAFTLDSDSIILGQDAGKHAAATAENNVIIGVSAGISASNDNNVLIGKQAGEKVTGDGSDNVFIGYQSGQQGAGKEENVAIGRDALKGYASSDGSDRNVALGYYAGRLFQNSTDNIAVGYYAGHGNGSGGTSAVRNVFLGSYAGYNHWNGIQDNIYVGYYAGAFNQQGDRNIIIGSGSTANGNPSDQLRIGHSTLHVISGSLTTGDVIFYNTASAPNFSGSFQGDGSALTGISTTPFPFTGDAQITGSLTISGSFSAFTLDSDNVVLGALAGGNMQAGADNNVLIGSSAGFTLSTGDRNVFIGDLAGRLNNGEYNVFLGRRAGYENTSNNNVFLGYNAGYNGGGGASNNVAIGTNSMLGTISHGGDYNTAVGYATLYSVNGGRYNLTLGYEAGYSIAGGNDNILLGQDAGYDITSGNNNIIIGSGSKGEAALENQLRIGNSGLISISASLATGDVIFYNTASAPNFSGSFQGDGSNLTGISSTPFPFTGDAQITGSLTISGSFTAFTLDSDNVVLGANTGTSMLAGADRNVILGTNTGNSLTTGDNNILIGDNTGGTLDTESNNIMMGYYAGGSSDGGQSNVYIGVLAGRYGLGAGYNVAIGYGALTGGNGNTGDYNTAIGYGAGGSIDNGTFNNFMGFDAGGDVTTGAYNTILGPYAGNKIVDGSTNITIGHLAGAGIISGNRNIVIGYSASVAGDASEMLVIGSGSLATISASLATGDIIFRSTASAAYFSGDGSQLTNLPASSTFPFTGDAQITGSLEVSGSFKVVSATRGTMLNIDANTLAIGPGASAGGGYTAVAIGHNASTGNNYSVSIGSGATTNASTYAVAIGGVSNSANGTGAVTIGGNSVTANQYGISIGYQAAGSGDYSINLGRSSRGTGANSITFNTSGDTIAAPSNTRAFNVFLSDGTGNPDFVISASNESKLSGSSFTIENSGSTIFSIQGSQGQLFSVTDDLLDEVFSVADISGDTLLSVSGSGLVTIPVGDLTGSATATASYGAFKGDGSQLTNITAATTASYVETSEYTTRWDVTNNGSSAYRFAGNGVGSTDDNPDIYLTRGEKYLFNLNASGHPFQIRVSNGGSAYNDGVTNNGAQTGEVIFEVPFDSPNHLYYQCTNHGGMIGRIQMVGSFISSSFDMLSPDGTIFRFTVNNSGHLSVTGSSV